MLAVNNAFAAALSFQRPEATARGLRRIDTAYRQGGQVLRE
jgi:hypothetical protein